MLAVALLGALVAVCTPADGSVRAGTSLPQSLDAEAFSGQGELAFVSSGALFVLDGSTQSVRRVTTGQPVPFDPAFSHDGRWLAFLRPGGGQGEDVLWMARGDGADAHRVKGIPAVVEIPDSDGSVMSWDPTRDQLLVTTGPVIGAPLVPRQVWIVSPTGPPRRLLGPGYVNGVAWSPDGTQVAAVWSATGLDDEALESVPAGGGPATSWIKPNAQAQYFLAGWSSHFGILLWLDAGGGGPSTGNYGWPLGVIPGPGASITELGTVPVFQQPALAIGAKALAIVVNGNTSNGQGEGEKFVWFGKTVERCQSGSACSPVSAPTSSVTDDPTISLVDGSTAFIEAPQSRVDLPPLYSSAASWEQVESWYAGDALWTVQAGSDAPDQVADTTGAVDPVFSEEGSGLVFVKDQALWLLSGPASQPVEIAGPLQRPPSPYLFGYIGWPDEFAWWG